MHIHQLIHTVLAHRANESAATTGFLAQLPDRFLTLPGYPFPVSLYSPHHLPDITWKQLPLYLSLLALTLAAMNLARIIRQHGVAGLKSPDPGGLATHSREPRRPTLALLSSGMFHEIRPSDSGSLPQHGEDRTAPPAKPLQPQTPLSFHEAEPLLDQSIIEGLRELGDPELLKRLIGLFINDAGMIISELEEAFAGRDLDRARKASHTLKGSASSIGAKRLQCLAAEINERIRNNLCTADRSGIDQLHKVFGLTIEAFAGLTDSEGSN